MKTKRFACIFLFALMLLLTSGLAGCSVSRLSFNAERYILYMDGVRKLTPEVIIRPKDAAYALTSSNPSIVQVLEDGISVEALRAGTVTITATAEKRTATATVVVYEENIPDIPPPEEIESRILVSFFTTYGSIEAQRVKEGEKANRPADPYRVGYRVKDWYTDVELKNLYDFDTPVTAPLTLYPEWEYVPATFNFRLNADDTYSIRSLQYPNIPYETVELPSEHLGKKVVSVAEEAFLNNVYIQTAVLNENITEIEDKAFWGCTALKSVTNATNLKTIGTCAFEQARKLNEFALSDTITEIKAGAFLSCENFAPEKLPRNLTVLEQQVFDSTAIKKVDLTGIAKVGKKCFYSSDLLEIAGTDDLTTVESQAFYGTPWMQTQYDASRDHLIYLNDILLYLDSRSRTDVTVKEGTRLIANFAFYHYVNLNAELIIRLPATIPSMGIVRNTVTGVDEPAIPVESVSTPVTLVVPEEKFQDYITDEVWKRYYLSPEAERNSARQSMYRFAASVGALEVLVKPTEKKQISVVKYRGNAEIYDLNAALTEAFENFTVDRIFTSAFYNLQNLKTLILPDCVKKYDTNAVNDCENLTALYIAGDWDGTLEDRYRQLPSNGKFFTVVSRYFKIYVPTELLTTYKKAWYNSYTVGILESYNPSNLPKGTIE